MYFSEMRNECPMRGNLGNCSPVGGFCPNAVSDEICEIAHNAYDKGWTDAINRMKSKSIVQQGKQE